MTVNKDFPESCPGRICRMLLKTGCQARRRKPEGFALWKGNNEKMEWWKGMERRVLIFSCLRQLG